MNDRHNVALKIKKAFVFSATALFLLTLISAPACQQSAAELPFLYGQTDWERMGLKGNVSSLTLYEVSWQESFGKISLKPEESVDQSTKFLDTGNQCESAYFSLNGLPSWKDEFIYADDDETWLECVSYRYADPEKTVALPQWSYANFYDDDGRLVKVEGYNYDGAGQKPSSPSWTHTYDYLMNEGKIVHSSYSQNGTLQWKNVSLYDGNGFNTESVQYDNNGAIQWKDKFKYDAKGNKTEWGRYNADSSLQWKDVFKYDDKGNEIECANYDHTNTLVWKNTYLYVNELGSDGFDINKNAGLKNEFDGNGNWIMRLTLEEKEGFGGSYYTVKDVEKRAITYFP